MVLFRKRKHIQDEAAGFSTEQNLTELIIPIEYDMLLKGPEFERRGEKVRQATVTVDGATRLVTSGDHVDHETYRALVIAGAIEPIDWVEAQAPSQPAIIEDPAIVEDSVVNER